MNYNKDNTWVYSCKYHIIWCPKYRRNVLVNGIDERLKILVESWQEEKEYKILQLEVMPNHIHILLETTADVSIPDLVKCLKARTARILRKEFPHLKSQLPNLWTRSKFVATVGAVSLETVKKYIDAQKGV